MTQRTTHLIDRPDYLRRLKVGQRVLASFCGEAARLGVVSSAAGPRDLSVSVQFQPVGAHFSCHRVSAYGDANGWTDAEYRIERERSYGETRAASVERERRERYPDKPFSMYRGARS